MMTSTISIYKLMKENKLVKQTKILHTKLKELEK